MASWAYDDDCEPVLEPWPRARLDAGAGPIYSEPARVISSKGDSMAKDDTALAEPKKEQLYELLSRALQGEVDLTEMYDTEAVQRGLADGILSAENEDQVFGDAGLVGWSELVDVPVEVTAVHFNPSNVENGPAYYCVVNLTQLDTGETSIRHVGGYRPVAQLTWLWYRDRFPFKCKLTEVAKAKSGQNAPLGIVRLADKPS